MLRSGLTFQVALHACGVATDMVIEHCLKTRASFVTCPCCYGFIQNTSKFSFPKRWNLVFRRKVSVWVLTQYTKLFWYKVAMRSQAPVHFLFPQWQVLIISCIRKRGSPPCLPLHIYSWIQILLKFRTDLSRKSRSDWQSALLCTQRKSSPMRGNRGQWSSA